MHLDMGCDFEKRAMPELKRISSWARVGLVVQFSCLVLRFQVFFPVRGLFPAEAWRFLSAYVGTHGLWKILRSMFNIWLSSTTMSRYGWRLALHYAKFHTSSLNFHPSAAMELGKGGGSCFPPLQVPHQAQFAEIGATWGQWRAKRRPQRLIAVELLHRPNRSLICTPRWNGTWKGWGLGKPDPPS